jgi:hypothetical protein
LGSVALEVLTMERSSQSVAVPADCPVHTAAAVAAVEVSEEQVVQGMLRLVLLEQR